MLAFVPDKNKTETKSRERAPEISYLDKNCDCWTLSHESLHQRGLEALSGRSLPRARSREDRAGCHRHAERPGEAGHIRRDGFGDDTQGSAIALSVLTHIAVLTGNAGLADGIAEVSLERARFLDDSDQIFEVVCRLVECAGVIPDRAIAWLTLGRRLEILAFILPASGTMAGLAIAIERLKRVQSELAPHLGRALAAARLGVPRSAA
jgi:hypothetical protein